VVRVTWTPPTTRNGTFLTAFTYSASQTLPYPAQRSNSTDLPEITLEGDNNSFTIARALPFAEYMITVQPFNVKTGNRAAPVTITERSIAIGEQERRTYVPLSLSLSLSLSKYSTSPQSPSLALPCLSISPSTSPEPTVVLGLRAEGVSSTSIMVSWSLPQYPNGGPITHYNVYYLLTPTGLKQDPNNINVDEYKRKRVNSTETLIDGLEVYRNYSIVVQAVVEVEGSDGELRGALLEVVQRTFSDFPTVPPDVLMPGDDTTSTITISLPDHTYIDTGDVM